MTGLQLDGGTWKHHKGSKGRQRFRQRLGRRHKTSKGKGEDWHGQQVTRVARNQAERFQQTSVSIERQWQRQPQQGDFFFAAGLQQIIRLRAVVGRIFFGFGNKRP